MLAELTTAERDEDRQDQRQRKDEEREQDRQLAEHWTTVRREFETTMRAAGFHNPDGRGWRKRQAAKADHQLGEGGADGN